MLSNLKLMKVYSGKPGCMCGCKGKWTYTGDMVAAGSKERGYAVSPEEVNERVAKAHAKLLDEQWRQEPATVKVEPHSNGVVCVFHETPTRYRAAYYAPEAA